MRITLVLFASFPTGCPRSNDLTGPTMAPARSADEPTPVPRMPIERVRRPDHNRTPTQPPPATATAPSPAATFTAVPTSTPVPPTLSATPTPGQQPVTVLGLRGIPWQWDFSGPGDVPISSTSPYPGQNTITLRIGRTYEIHIYDNAFQEDLPHYFSGVSAIGLPGARVAAGAPEIVLTFTPTTTGDFPFLCTNVCGVGHDNMHGRVQVVP